jgi:hypothetical protein
MFAYKLRGSFVCDGDECGYCVDSFSNYPNRLKVGCLGEWCDDPCPKQKKDSDLTIQMLIDLCKYFGGKCIRLFDEDDLR